MYDRFQTSTPNLSNNSPLIQLKHTHRLEGVDGKQFKSRMTQLETWFIEFSDVQRNVVLRKLFPHFTPAQIQLLLINMEPFMDAFCMHNCQVSFVINNDDIVKFQKPFDMFKDDNSNLLRSYVLTVNCT